MPQNDLEQLIRYGHEERNLEYKRSISWGDKDIQRKITKTILAMANLRDGGSIILGVEEQNDGTYEPIGMRDEDAESFNYDDVVKHVSKYAVPYIEMSLRHVVLENMKFVVIQVQEFSEIPIVCGKNYGDQNGNVEIAEGDVLIRGNSKPETIKLQKESEMRELLDLAIKKGVRKFLQTANEAGLGSASSTNDRELFENQLGDL